MNHDSFCDILSGYNCDLKEKWRCARIDYKTTLPCTIQANKDYNTKFVANKIQNGKFRLFRMFVLVDITEEYYSHDMTTRASIYQNFALDQDLIENRIYVRLLFAVDSESP